MVGGYAHIFCSSDGAAGAGHVAWGFWSEDKSIGYQYLFGSFDNTTANTRKKRIWVDFGSPRAMTDEFRYTGYDGWKFIYVPSYMQNAAAAKKVMNKWIGSGYVIYSPIGGANCLDFAYEVLHAYGAPLLPNRGSPANWRPRDFFDNVPWQKGPLLTYFSTGKSQTGSGKLDLYDTAPIRGR